MLSWEHLMGVRWYDPTPGTPIMMRIKDAVKHLSFKKEWTELRKLRKQQLVRVGCPPHCRPQEKDMRWISEIPDGGFLQALLQGPESGDDEDDDDDEDDEGIESESRTERTQGSQPPVAGQHNGAVASGEDNASLFSWQANDDVGEVHAASADIYS